MEGRPQDGPAFWQEKLQRGLGEAGEGWGVGAALSSLIAPALSDRPRPPSQGRRSQGRLGPKHTGAG